MGSNNHKINMFNCIKPMWWFVICSSIRWYPSPPLVYSFLGKLLKLQPTSKSCFIHHSGFLKIFLKCIIYFPLKNHPYSLPRRVRGETTKQEVASTHRFFCFLPSNPLPFPSHIAASSYSVCLFWPDSFDYFLLVFFYFTPSRW